MPKIKIPIKTPIYQNVDEIVLTEFNAALIDGYMDESGNTYRRPGLTLWNNLWTGAKVDGLYWWKKYGYLIAVSNGRIWKVTAAGAVPVEITGDTLIAGTRPIFCEDQTHLFMANGGRITHYNNAGATTAMADANAPTAVTHIAFHDQYLICNNVGTGQMHHSNLATPLVWAALNYVVSESNPDNIEAMNIAWREILLLGRDSAEIYYDDGVYPFSRLEGAFCERGCSAPYSLAFFDNTWHWLDHTRRVIRIEGRSPTVISTPFDKTIQGYTTISDVMSDLVEIGGRTFWVLSFPTEEKTLVYDYMPKLWYEWTWWNSKIAAHQRWLGNCVCYAKEWNKWLVGSRFDGKIYEMSQTVYTDEDDAIRTVRRTGHVYHETLTRKRSNSVELKVRRGVGFPAGAPDEVTGTDGEIYTCIIDHTSTTLDKPITGQDWVLYWKHMGITGGVWFEGVSYSAHIPYLIVRWRDDGKSTWGNEHYIDLGKVGDTEFIGKLKRLGIYSARQWEFILSDAVPLVLCEAEESVEVLEDES